MTKARKIIRLKLTATKERRTFNYFPVNRQGKMKFVLILAIICFACLIMEAKSRATDFDMEMEDLNRFKRQESSTSTEGPAETTTAESGAASLGAGLLSVIAAILFANFQ